MGLRDIKHRVGERIKDTWPGLYRFLTREDKPYPFLRDIAGIAGVLLVLGLVLWTYTGQDFPDAPVVVVESSSMMHCDNGFIGRGAQCDGPFGRLGTIDAGDLIFIQDVDGRSDVETFLASRQGGREGYGMPGDVIVFARNGAQGTPIIHRAMFWLQIHEDGSISIPELDRTFEDRTDLREHLVPGDDWRTQNCRLDLSWMSSSVFTPAGSGFITMGDNNPCFDQSNGIMPVQPAWILGKARGELPWIGVVKLQLTDWFSDPGVTKNVATHVPGDIKFLTWTTVFILLGLPFVAEQVARSAERRRGTAHPTRPAGQLRDVKTTMLLAAVVPGGGGLYAHSAPGFVKGFLSQTGALVLVILAVVGGNALFILFALAVLGGVIAFNVLNAQDLAEDYNARPEA